MRPKISVLVPAHNEEAVIEGTLRALLDQTVPVSKYEIVVVDDGSEDATSDIVEAVARKNPGANVRVVRKEQAGGKSSAINRGVKEVRAPKVLITDADITVSRDWIEVMARGLDKYDMVQGAWFGYKPEKLIQRMEHAHMLAEYRYGGLYVKLTRNGANNGFRREVYGKAGPFDERSTVCTQGFYQRGLDAGYSLAYLPESQVYTQLSPSFGSYVKQQLRWREYDGPGSLLRTGWKGLLFTLGLSTLVFLTLFVLPFLFPVLPLFLDAYWPWWNVWVMMGLLLMCALLVEYGRFMGPLIRMYGRAGRREDRVYAKYLLLLPLALFFLRVLTIPYYIYRAARPRRSGVFEPNRTET